MTGDGDSRSDARRPEREAEPSRAARESMLARHKLIEAMIDAHGKDFAMGALVLTARFIAEGKPLTKPEAR